MLQNISLKKTVLCLLVLLIIGALSACGEKENLPVFSFDGTTIAYRARMLDELSEDGKPQVRVEYVSATKDGKTRKGPDDVVNVLTRTLYAFRGLRLQAGDASYSITNMSKDAAKNLWYSLVPVAADVPKDAGLAVKYPVPGQSPSFLRQGYTITYEAYFLGDLSEDGRQQIMIDFESGTNGQKRLDRRELADLMIGIINSEPLTLKVEGKPYPVNSVSVSSYLDQSKSPPQARSLASYSILEVPADTPRDSSLTVE